MLQRADSWEQLRADFAWRIPDRYNIGTDIIDRHAGADDRLALVHERGDGRIERLGFATIRARSNRLANALAGLGVARGDRVGILLPQSPEAAIAHATVYRMGAIALPLFTQFGPDALRYRLNDSGVRALITDADNVAKVADLRAELPALEQIICTGDEVPAGVHGFDDLLAAAADPGFTPVDTAADDPALIIYTSGTTGDPKGALHAHRTLLGHLPGVELPQDFFPRPGDLFWTPADWAWIGGLIDVLLPSWHHGVPVLSRAPRRFDPEDAFETLARHRVRNVFLPPTALKMMRQVPSPQRFGHAVRSIGSGGETLGAELLDWGREAFGVTINEFYGQTECNLVIANCATLLEPRPGSMGRAVPGHDVAVVDDTGDPLPDGEMGNIAVRAPDPVMFLGYWGKPEATREKFAGDWLLTGDLGRRDAEGWFRFAGRDDDVITSSGYRIGPAEVEDCLLRHPAVAMAAVIGERDDLRTEIVKAFIVPAREAEPGDALRAEIQAFTKQRLAGYAYPRSIEFVDSLPMTATGKVQRRLLRGQRGR